MPNFCDRLVDTSISSLACRFVIGAIQCQCPRMNHLPRLVDRFFRRQKNRDLVFQTHILGKLGRPNRRLRYIMELITADQSRRKTKLSFGRSPAIQSALKKDLWLCIRLKKFDLLNVPGEDHPHISHYFTEPHPYWNQDVAVIGAKNSAAKVIDL